jgi:hypothetical protein
VATRPSRLPKQAAAPARAVAAPAPGGSLYMFGPGIDLAFVAGGLTFALLPLCLAVSPRLSQVSFLFLNFVCNYPHYMATNYRIYRSRAQIERYRFFAVHVTGLFVLTAILGHLLAGPWITALYTLYFTWSPFHYTGQNDGIAVMYLRRGGAELPQTDKRLLYVACIASFLMYLVFINTNLQVGALTTLPLFRLGMPASVARPVYLVLLAIGTASAATFLWRMFHRATPRIMLPSVLLLTTQFTWFAVAAGIPLFARELSLGWVSVDSMVPAIAFLHCAQYLGVTAYYAKREHAPGQAPFRFSYYFLVVILGGILLWLGSARLLSDVFAVDYSLSFLIMLSLINLHHFVMDGAIWKLRDGRIARLLIGEPPAPAAALPKGRRDAKPRSAAVVPPVETGARWPRGWRLAAWTAAGVAALALAATDVAYRVFVLQASELARAGRLAEARALYERVLRINPHAAEAVDGLAYDALQAGNVNVALARWERSIRLNPMSAYPRVGIGETYLRLGRVDDAIAQLERATELAPGQPSGFLLLAEAYRRKGDAAQASALRSRANDVAAQQSASASAGGPRLLYY